MARSPTAKSLQHLRRSGYVVAVVEHWNSFGGPRDDKGNAQGIRQDLFGVFDILAVQPGQTLGVQSTSLSNMRNRFRKITGRLPIKDDKQLEDAMKRRAAVEACFAAGWDIAIFGHEKGTTTPQKIFVAETDLVQLQMAPVVEPLPF